MTDIHSHIMFNVDDGSKSLEESIELLKKMKVSGFDSVVLTPHYICDSTYSVANDLKLEKLELLKNEVLKNNLDIDLYLGNEVLINNGIVDDINNNNIYTLNGSRYLLFELSFNFMPVNLFDVIYELKFNNYIPILAHPERYLFFQEDYNLIDKLRSKGVLFQVNYGSILGFYGKDAMKLVKYILKNRYVDYFGTDIHRIDNCFVLDNFSKIERRIKSIIGDDYYNLIIANGDKLVSKNN